MSIAVTTSRAPWQLAIGYSVMTGAAVALFFLIRQAGDVLTLAGDAPAAPASALATPGASDALLHVLLALAAVIVVGRGLGLLLRRLGQPAVIGEVLAGILLGPSLLGRVWPAGAAFVLPETVAPYLDVLAQLGIIFSMFMVGLHLNAGLLRRQAQTTVAVSHASIVVPFLLGAALALWLYPTLAPPGVPFTSFALFMGVALAITAFPVLARILTDRGIEHTELGVLALGCAAADDVTAWCLLAFVVGVTRADVSSAVLVIGLTLVFIAVMLGIVRPLAARLAAWPEERVTPSVLAAVLTAVLLAALTTEAIGIHAIFGAFLLGVVIPHDCAVARVVQRKLTDVVTILLLPAFFAYTGMRTQIGLVDTGHAWLVCGIIIGVATVGKFGGAVLAGRLTGLSWRTASALGVLMNTRGLMELIVLNIGLDLGVISPPLFAMLVLMALATTLATTPALTLLRPDLTPA